MKCKKCGEMMKQEKCAKCGEMSVAKKNEALSFADKKFGGKGPQKIPTVEKKSPATGSGGEIEKGPEIKKNLDMLDSALMSLVKAAPPMAKPPSGPSTKLPTSQTKKPAAPKMTSVAASTTGTKAAGASSMSKSVYNIKAEESDVSHSESKCEKCGEMYKGEACAKCGDMTISKSDMPHGLYPGQTVIIHSKGEFGEGHSGQGATIIGPSTKIPGHLRVETHAGYTKHVHPSTLKVAKVLPNPEGKIR